MKRILVPTDFTAVSDRAMALAAELAASFGAEIVLLHAVEPVDADGDSPEIDGFHESLKAKAAEELRAGRERIEALGVGARATVEVKKRWLSIVELAEREHVDLIVMGAHPVVDTGRVNIGSTSHRVFLAARTPLLIVRDTR